MKIVSSAGNNGKGGNPLSPFVVVLVIITGVWQLMDVRIQAVDETIVGIEKRSSESAAKFWEILGEVRSQLSADIKAHTTTDGHSGVMAKLASIEIMFKEVETQFRMISQRLEDGLESNQSRIGELEKESIRRVEMWIPRIVTLETEMECAKGKQP